MVDHLGHHAVTPVAAQLVFMVHTAAELFFLFVANQHRATQVVEGGGRVGPLFTNQLMESFRDSRRVCGADCSRRCHRLTIFVSSDVLAAQLHGLRLGQRWFLLPSGRCYCLDRLALLLISQLYGSLLGGWYCFCFLRGDLGSWH